MTDVEALQEMQRTLESLGWENEAKSQRMLEALANAIGLVKGNDERVESLRRTMKALRANADVETLRGKYHDAVELLVKHTCELDTEDDATIDAMANEVGL
jgi:hypothetical protein